MSGMYYTLMGSLPALPTRFEDAGRVPISHPRLEDRLKMLEAEDAEVIEQMADFLVWDRQPGDRTDEQIVRQYEQFTNSVKNRFTRDLMEERMGMRTIIAALRRRRLGLFIVFK